MVYHIGSHGWAWVRRGVGVHLNGCCLLLPDLFGVAEFNIGPFLHKLGVALQEINAPTGVFLQVLKLVLKQQHRENK